ncbi:hypothetical protein [Phaeobacter inhibens]|uniref:hypothetical protein n=1 Tax=Phaeobacter inhibens TaxID=221822 RepID=UPI000C9A2AD2|nr:hypothetical protein [Phaeobacter inhibens]AUQ64402.1 hypothetical protein PhaeoP51_03471 [Phaeobacter inhibens]
MNSACNVRQIGKTIEKGRKDFAAASAPTQRLILPPLADAASGTKTHDWSAGAWKHKPQPMYPHNPFLTAIFSAILIFCCIVAAVSIGYQLWPFL